jgi:hypothetical protein
MVARPLSDPGRRGDWYMFFESYSLCAGAPRREQLGHVRAERKKERGREVGAVMHVMGDFVWHALSLAQAWGRQGKAGRSSRELEPITRTRTQAIRCNKVRETLPVL